MAYNNPLLPAAAMERGSCVAFGMFDGVHAGHLAVLDALNSISMENALTPVLLRYAVTLNGVNERNHRLTTEDETDKLVWQIAPKCHIIPLPLDEAESLNAERYIKELLVDKFNAKIIVAGANCRYGKNGDGNAETLRACADKYGFRLVVVDTIYAKEIINGDIKTDIANDINNDPVFPEEAVSGNIIRNALLNKDIASANKLLTRPFFLRGVVASGKSLGRQVSMPTANLRTPPQKFIPAHGVYATVVKFHGEEHIAITNIGTRPSVDSSDEVSIETHILDFSGDLYGMTIEVELHKHIRDIRKFNDINEVKAQVDIDIAVVREYFRAARR